MSDIGGDADPITQRWIIDMDETAARRLIQQVRELAEQAALATEKETKKGNRRQEQQFKAHLEQVGRLQRAHIQKMLQDNAAANAKMVEQQVQANRIALQNQRQADRLAVQQQEHRNKQIRNAEREAHHLRLEAQKAADKQELQARKAADAVLADQRRLAARRVLEDQRQADRLAVQSRRHADNELLQARRAADAATLQAQRHANAQILEETREVNRERLVAVKAAIAKELIDYKEAVRDRARASDAAYRSMAMAQRSAERIRENAAKEAEKRITATMQSENRRQEIATQAHQDRITARHKAMWSTVRTLTETGSRFMSSITQSALRSMGNAVGYGFRRIVGETREGTSRQEAILRDSMNDQTRIITVAMARQEGVIGSFQQTVNRGAVGSLLNLRNAALGLGGYLSARAIFGPVADYQQTEIAFNGLLGSAERSTRFLTQLRNFARVTPFEFQGVADGARRLLAVGFAARDVIPTLSTIGDVAANLGAGTEEINGVIRALGQMQGKGKASAEELNQISEQLPGFSAVRAIAESLGITVAEAFGQMRAGAIPADVAIQAILEGMRNMPGAAGAMERQSRTLNGRLSTLRDTVRDLTIDAINPFIDRISDAVGVFTGWIESLFRGSGVWAVVRSGLLGISVALGAILAQRAAVATMELLATTLKLIAANPLTATAIALTTIATILYRHNGDFHDFVDGFLRGILDFGRGLAGPAQQALETIGDVIGAIGTAIADRDWSTLGDLVVEGLSMAFNAIRGAAAQVAEFARPFAEVLIAGAQYAFYSFQLWLETGGIGRLVAPIANALSRAWDEAWKRLSGLGWGNVAGIVAAGLAVAFSAAVAGIPGLIVSGIVAGLLARSPRLREGITHALSGIGEWLSSQLPGLLYRGLHDAVEFLTGPVLATIFGPLGVRIVAGIAASLVAASVAISTGIADGLKRSAPSIIDAVQGLVNDIVTAIAHGLADIPVIGEIIRGLFAPVEVVLRGLIPTIGLFVDIVRAIPTPVIAASVAVYALVKAWTALNLTAKSQGFLVAIQSAMQTIALRVAYAGDAIAGIGTRLTNATAPAIMNGAASRAQLAMGAIGTAAQGAGSAISAIGFALPGIATAAAVGLPIILGMWQSAQAAAKRHREEINRNGQALLDMQTTSREVLTQIIRDSDAAAEALRQVGVSTDAVFESLVGGTDDVGELYARLTGLSDVFVESGADMGDFGAAVLEGDQAVRDFFVTLRSDQATAEAKDRITDLQYAYTNLPGPLRDAADQMAENARSMLTQAAVTGQLTAAEQERLATILAMEHPEARLIDMQSDVEGRLQATRRAAELQDRAYQNLKEKIDDVANSTSLFNDVLDRLTGNALPLTRVRQNIEDALARFRELMNDPEASPAEQERAFADYAEAIRNTSSDLLNLHRPMREVLSAYQLQRQELINQRIAFGDTRAEARDYVETVLGLPPVSEMRVEFKDRAATDHIARIQSRMEGLVQHPWRPEVRMDLERYHLQKVALEAELQGLSDTQIAIRVQMVATVDAAWQAEIDRLAADDNPAVAALGRQLQQAWALNLPQLAEGGIVTQPTIALIGEAGPEAVVPLTGNAAGSIPFTISFDQAMVASQVDAVVAIIAPMGAKLIEATDPGMRQWRDSIDAYLLAIRTGFESWGDRMVTIATTIATSIADAMTSGLRAGRREVVGIARGYARSLVNALNPLLTGIGEDTIALNFARGGIAEAGHGPQVHIFNEGRSGRGSTHGEAYIPFDPANRSRSRDLAVETVRRLGGNVQWFAQGGVTAGSVQPGQSVPGVSGDIVGLVNEFARRLSTWSLANGGGYRVNSGYRSIAEQTVLYRRYLAGQGPLAAPPGSSLHNFGLASDGNHWGNRNPGAFGLSFAVPGEPWHVQPVEGRGLLSGDSFPSFDPVPEPPGAGGRGWLSRVARHLMRHVYDKVLAYAGDLSMTSAMPTLGSAGASPEILAAIQRAMGIVGVPSTWLGPLLTLISRESGFNPRAYNGVLGASGLMQTIPSTFAANALPGYGGIFDPVANVIAGLRYILGRYGSIFNVGQAVSPTPTRGYANGGIVQRDGLYRLAEGNRREAVLPLTNKARTMDILRQLGLDRELAADSATSRTVGPTRVVEKVEVNQTFQTQATDPRIIAGMAERRVTDGVRDGLSMAGAG